jgi:predicted O-linked N-acetylglucosamine transferase (SPINDLY family)
MPGPQIETLRAQARVHLRQMHNPRLAPLALAYYEKALALDAHNLVLMCEYAQACLSLGQKAQAVALCERALRDDPHSPLAQWALACCQIPRIYATAGEVEASRAAYAAHLQRFAAQLDLADPARVAQADEALVQWLPFFLAHQAQNDAALQRLYGEMRQRVSAARYAAFAAAPPVPPPPPGQPLRVGLVADEFRLHSVWKVILKGWMTQLDPARVALYGYATDERSDAETEVARAHCVRFVQGDFGLEEWAGQIRADRLHVLIYSAIGMTKMPSLLATLRLAPVQCVATGHALTSGLPGMDYCLSGALIESAQAEAYYSERLVRLPHLGIYYEETPLALTGQPRAAFGLRAGAVVYFMPHNLCKFLPQYDFIFPAIARAVGDCQFVLMQNKQAAPLTRQFEKRLAQAFAGAGLDVRQYLVTHPRLEIGAYQTLQHHADVYLDSLGYGGMTSTLEALAYNLPVVTRRGAYYRDNFSAALLERIGVTETIAASPEEYVALACRLGSDPAWRAGLRARISAQKHRAYADRAAIAGLQAFLEAAALQPAQA